MAKSLTQRGVDYRHAKAAVADHLRTQARAEQARTDYLRTRRGVPRDVLYDPETGAATDPTLINHEAAVWLAEVDVAWCQALVVACGEAYKGCALADVPNERAALPSILTIAEEG